MKQMWQMWPDVLFCSKLCNLPCYSWTIWKQADCQGGAVDEEDLVKKKGKKPNGSKREECEEAGELFLEVRKRYYEAYLTTLNTLYTLKTFSPKRYYEAYLKTFNPRCRRSLQRRSLFVLWTWLRSTGNLVLSCGALHSLINCVYWWEPSLDKINRENSNLDFCKKVVLSLWC